MTRYRIFITNAGGFSDSTNYEYVAEFADQKIAANYIRYMCGKKRYSGKDKIVRVIDNGDVNPKEGRIDAVITALGESLPLEECEFV